MEEKFGGISLNFDPDEVAGFLSELHITGMETGGDMSDILEADHAREVARAAREGRATLTVLEE